MAKKLTPWFPPHVKPVRNGIYMVEDKKLPNTGPYYNYWDGLTWHYGNYDIRKSYCPWGTWESDLKHWRGLAEPPKDV